MDPFVFIYHICDFSEDLDKFGISSINKILNTKFNERILNDNIDIDWEFISINKKLPESFIEKYIDEFDIFHILEYQTVSEKFIENFAKQNPNEDNEFYWRSVFEDQVVSDEFVEKYKHKIDIVFED
jgi:hypothetical protein